MIMTHNVSSYHLLVLGFSMKPSTLSCPGAFTYDCVVFQLTFLNKPVIFLLEIIITLTGLNVRQNKTI